MGAKALYTDERRKIIHQLIISQDVEKAKGVLHDRDEYKQYASSWQAVNLDEYVAKFDISSDTYNMTHNQRKIMFTKDNRQFMIVAAVGGKYFRIQEIRPDGSGGRYVNLELKDPSIPGTFQGRDRKNEWLRLTHFRMTYKKGTV